MSSFPYFIFPSSFFSPLFLFNILILRYAPQNGFGWSNGVALDLMDRCVKE